ncbi:MAG TPA: NAD(P)/FAD-dependent oxidoreductase [Marmoricola sp.]|nr:NAD(P)/FAD-dependent oxidoreductase [Marmoricola sp.]
MVREEQVHVIGSGPAGLATAAELTVRGVRATVLERGASLGAAWRSRYDAMRFNTSRWHSHLPGAPFPRAFGQFPTRDQYVEYLEGYARARSVAVETGTQVTRLDPGRHGGWRLTTNRGDRDADRVVVATGIFNRPCVPSWPGTEQYGGQLLHSAAYRNAEPFRAQRVLVVGAGSTGMEIAHELARGGADRVWLSVRTPPNILLRMMNGLPADLPVPLFLKLPETFVDRLLLGMQRRTLGDLSGYGLPLPAEGPISRLRRDGSGTAIVDPEVLDALKDGRVRVVAAVRALYDEGAVLEDGDRLGVDAVVAATGYTTGLEDVVGHLGVLDDRGLPLDGNGAEVAQGLRFVGYVPRPGITGYVGKTARRVAREVARQVAAGPRSPVAV